MGAQPVSRISRFGPSALLTRANLVTALRFALTIPLLRVIVADGVSWRATVGWVMLACTDGLDGWLARRDGTTRSGAFLDPLADKFLAIGGLSALAAKGTFPWVAVVLIAVREVGVSAYRTAAGVPSSAENGKRPAQSSPAASTKSRSASWSSSVSPGKPTMNEERKAAPGSRRRMAPIISRKRSPLPHRRMLLSSGSEACWRERSKYGTGVARSRMVPTNGSRTWDG